ncbi:MAG: YkgJ family cysteine cluster protein [Spirochaetaceae bacterium]|nr:YkgJ family cysteine cluster protein [Spirochaetaceae bacterium]
MSSRHGAPFFADGLRFDCTRCQRCCRIDPGVVLMSQNDLDQLSTFLNLPEGEVRERYCRAVDMGGVTQLSLRERDNYDCVFWEEGGCSVYAARPLQCRSFPFWPAQLADRESWRLAGGDCPGIGTGPLHSAIEIAYWLARRDAEPLLTADGAAAASARAPEQGPR